MDKETLSNYGWIVIAVLVLVVMIALATPFGTFVSEAVQSTTKGLFDVNKNALDAAGIVISNQKFEKPYDPMAPELNPDDGTTPVAGQIYTCGNYQYCYQYEWCGGCKKWSSPDGCNHKYTCDSWSVRCINNVADPGPILVSISGEYVKSLDGTFAECRALTTAPIIPVHVTSMNYTFDRCTSLITYAGSTDADGDFSGFIIPDGVNDMRGGFQYCTALTVKPIIPPSVPTSQSNIFRACTQFGY